MPVDTKHKQFTEMCTSWQTVRDCLGGAKAVKARGETYLPRLSWKKDQEKKYQAYRSRAVFENAVRRTHDGVTGLVFCTPPDVTVPESFESRLNNITLTGVAFEDFARRVFSAVVAPGRCGVLVDTDATIDTPGAAEPYFTIYAAEAVVNWRAERRDGAQVLTRVVLFEVVEESSQKDPFDVNRVEQYRVIELVDGVVAHQVWRRNDVGQGPHAEWVPYGEPIYPKRRGQALDFIPFVFVNPLSAQPDVEEPPLLDLAEVNLSLYRTSADIEHARHFLAVPTPYLFGASDIKGDLEIGGTAWTSQNENAKVGFLEFTGAGLGALEKAVEEKREQMIAMGARLIEKQKRAAETAEALRLRQSAESSLVAAIAKNVGAALQMALTYAAWWAGVASSVDEVLEQVSVELNTEFEEQVLTPTDAKALAEMWLSGGMSKRSYAWNLQQGKRLPPDTTIEQEIAMIEVESAQRGMPEDDAEEDVESGDSGEVRQ